MPFMPFGGFGMGYGMPVVWNPFGGLLMLGVLGALAFSVLGPRVRTSVRTFFEL